MQLKLSLLPSPAKYVLAKGVYLPISKLHSILASHGEFISFSCAPYT